MENFDLGEVITANDDPEQIFEIIDILGKIFF